MATYDTWGGSWGDAWGISWTRTVPVPPTTTIIPGAGSGKYRKRFSNEYEVLLYMEGLQSEFRALKAKAVHVEEVKEGAIAESPRTEATLPAPIAFDIRSLNSDFSELEALEEAQASDAAKLALLERVITKLEALDAAIREEEEMLLLH